LHPVITQKQGGRVGGRPLRKDPLFYLKKGKIMVDLLDNRLYTVSITIRKQRAK